MSAFSYPQYNVSASFYKIINASALTDRDVSVYQSHRLSIRDTPLREC